jgi:hypothetical protein
MAISVQNVSLMVKKLLRLSETEESGNWTTDGGGREFVQ